MFVSTAGNGDIQGPTDAVGSHADCRVNFHAPGSLDTSSGAGVCPTNDHLDFAILNSSVGFTTQICVDYDTDVGGELTSLHMTIQPMCKVKDEDPQRWTICSWLRDDSAPLCMARPDIECCAYINTFISPPLPAASTLSCQEYVEGDCNMFYGYNRADKGDAAGVQTYALELISCEGSIPPNPTCAHGLTADRSIFGNIGAGSLTAGYLGFGLLLVAAAMAIRRQRLMREDEDEYYEGVAGNDGRDGNYDTVSRLPSEAPSDETEPLMNFGRSNSRRSNQLSSAKCRTRPFIESASAGAPSSAGTNSNLQLLEETTSLLSK
jgi:hypothetical protein